MTFAAMSIATDNGATVALRAACRIGNVLIPSPVDFSVQILGCPPGQVPLGYRCTACSDGLFSHGGADVQCNPCPRQGAVCRGGILRLADNFYRPPSEAALPIASNSTLIPCPITGTCLFNASAAAASGSVTSSIAGSSSSSSANLGADAFYCADGYAGPLCSVCDRADGYSRFGTACAPCWDPFASRMAVALILLLIIGLLFAVASMTGSEGTRSPGSIALRILLTYVQSLGAIRAFRAGGSELFKQAFSFTEVVSASPFSSGPVDCALGWSWLTRFLITETMPFLAAIGVIISFLAIVVVGSFRCRCLDGVRRAVTCPSWKSICWCCTGAAVGAAAPLAQTARRSQTVAGDSFGRTRRVSATMQAAAAAATTIRNWRSALYTFWLQRKHVTVTIYLLAFGYAPMVTTAIRALDCDEQPIDGILYLRSDRAVVCGSAAHRLASAVALTVIIGVGVGFPLWLFLSLWRASVRKLQQPGFRAAWGSLSDGYRWLDGYAPSSMAARSYHRPANTSGGTTSSTVAGDRIGGGGGVGAVAAAAQSGSAAQSSRLPVRLGMESKLETQRAPLGTSPLSAAAPSQQQTAGADPEELCWRQRQQAWASCCDWRQRGISCCGRRFCKSGVIFRHLLWYESTVLVRKLVLVVLATLVTDAAVQLSGVAALMLGCLLLQLQLVPYSRRLFNWLETAALFSALSTAIISSVLLRSTAEADQDALQAAASTVTGDAALSVSSSASSASGFGLASKEAAATAFLVILNSATLALLCVTVAWLYVSDCLRSPAVHKAMTGVSGRLRLLSNRNMLVGSTRALQQTGQASPQAAGLEMSSKAALPASAAADTDTVVGNPLAAALPRMSTAAAVAPDPAFRASATLSSGGHTVAESGVTMVISPLLSHNITGQPPRPARVLPSARVVLSDRELSRFDSGRVIVRRPGPGVREDIGSAAAVSDSSAAPSSTATPLPSSSTPLAGLMRAQAVSSSDLRAAFAPVAGRR